MFSESKIAFIGSGAMAEAMIGGLLQKHQVEPSQIFAAGPRPARGEDLQQRYQINVTTSNAEAADHADIIVLSIKPQMLSVVLPELLGSIRKDALVLSILAGTRLSRISKGLEHEFVVRAMPNTPAQIAEGISVWTATEGVSEKQQDQARAILQACGQEIYVNDEDYLDMATALSGNGPAYVFLFMEAMVDAGVHMGFPRYIAEQLVMQTVSGSVAFARQSPQHLARLRNQVTSPGGTSAEALYYLEKAGFRTALARAIWAGYHRSVHLGEGKKRREMGEID